MNHGNLFYFNKKSTFPLYLYFNFRKWLQLLTNKILLHKTVIRTILGTKMAKYKISDIGKSFSNNKNKKG